MDREGVRTVVRVILVALTRIAKRTRVQADDLMASILQANEERLVNAALGLLSDTGQPPTEDQVVAALRQVGIQV